MKGFKNTTKTIRGHSGPPKRVGKFAVGGLNSSDMMVAPASVAGGAPPGQMAPMMTQPGPMPPQGIPPPGGPMPGHMVPPNGPPPMSGAPGPMGGGVVGGGQPMPPGGGVAPPTMPQQPPVAGGQMMGGRPGMPGPMQRPPMQGPMPGGMPVHGRIPMYGRPQMMQRAKGGLAAVTGGPPPVQLPQMIGHGLSAPTLENGPMTAPQGGIGRSGASKPLIPRTRVMPNAKMASSMPMKALAKGGKVVDQKNSLPPRLKGDRFHGNALRYPVPFSELEADSGFKSGMRPGYAEGGLHINVKKGALHKRMGVKQGSPIGTKSISKDLSKAKASGNVREQRQDQFALNARKWNKAGGGSVSEDCASDAVQAVSRHVATPKPSGHGIKNGAPPFTKKPLCGGGRW